MKGRSFIKVLYLLLLFALVSCQERGERQPQAASPQVGTLSYDFKPLPPSKPEPLAWTTPVWQGYSLTLRTLGYRTGAELTGAQGEATLYLPVNPGLDPEALELKLAFSPGLPQGYLEILSQGQPVFQAALPAASLLIPLKGVKVERGLLTLTLRTQFPAKDLCAAQELFRVHVLPESRLLLAGRPTPPETLASFFPPHVERVVVHLPDPPSPEAAQAVLWLAGFLARTYPGRVPELRLEALPKAPLEPHPFVRHVVWQEGEGARLEGFALHLGSLREAARLFLAEPGLLQAPFPGEATEALSLKAPEELGPRVSLAELGYGPQRVEGFGVLTASYAFALADLGPKRHPVGLRLRAVHSPALSERGYVELLLNGVAFYSEPLEGTLLDLYAPVPARLLERNNTLEVRFRYAPAEGQCTYGALPFTATLDPASYLVLEGGEALSGLDAFPQALLPRFWVYLEPLDSFKLGLAARLVQALQETTKTPLLPEISPTPDRAPLLAVGGPGLPQALGAPLRTPGFRLVDSRGTPWLVVQPEGPYAALQAFSQKKGPLLLLSHTSTTGEILAPFLEEALKEGWFALHGEIALRGPSGPLVTFSLSKSGLRVQPLPETPASFLARYRKEVYLVLTALALLSLVALYPKVVRRGKA